jgi:hypothetical protein
VPRKTPLHPNAGLPGFWQTGGNIGSTNHVASDNRCEVGNNESRPPLALDIFEALAGQYRVPRKHVSCLQKAGHWRPRQLPRPSVKPLREFVHISTTAAAPARAVSPSVQQSQLPVEHHELSERDENRHFGADSGHSLSHKTGPTTPIPYPLSKST